jgi:regulator of sirC expression with transglutaminase-like and TPR domain
VTGRGPDSANAAVARFTTLVARPDRLDLAEAALVIARAAYPDLDVAAWLRVLDRLAEGVSDIHEVRKRLFDELGLRGDGEGYYDPDNSFLHRVLERRRGIPISLSVLTMEVAKRAGEPCDGVGMPGHFLVRTRRDGLLLDPFDGGRVLDVAGAETLFRSTTGAGPEIPFGPHLLPVLGPLDILVRLLANLRSLYRASGAAADLEWVLRMRFSLPRPSTAEIAELGEALAAQGRLLEGAKELELRALETDPEAALALRAAARALRARLN